MRNIQDRKAAAFALEPPSGDDIATWLLKRAREYASLELKWLLAHADDGLIWGEVMQESESLRLRTSDSITSLSPPLRGATLRVARLFSTRGEILLWHDDERQWQARLITEEFDSKNAASSLPGRMLESWDAYFDEPQLLWGDCVEEQRDGWSLLREGAQGLRHAVPLITLTEANGALPYPVELEVRHYLATGDFSQVAAGRLLNLRAGSATAA